MKCFNFENKYRILFNTKKTYHFLLFLFVYLTGQFCLLAVDRHVCSRLDGRTCVLCGQTEGWVGRTHEESWDKGGEKSPRLPPILPPHPLFLGVSCVSS
ncbi:hypothetical protein Btru_007109 [Bulinus truncatus]|nr:hypothetical protein Btru_007109 [Bulinus truncatus]